MVHASISEYVQKVHQSSSALKNVSVRLTAAPLSCDANQNRYTSYQFLLRVRKSVKDSQTEDTKPLAVVLRSPETVPYGHGQRHLLDIGAALSSANISSSGRILEPFMDTPILGLEQRMSADSILYVFAGFIDYAAAFSSRDINIELHRHRVDKGLLSRLSKITDGLFQGYDIRTLKDHDSLCQMARAIR